MTSAVSDWSTARHQPMRFILESILTLFNFVTDKYYEEDNRTNKKNQMDDGFFS